MTYAIPMIGLGWIATNVYYGGHLPHEVILAGAFGSAVLLTFLLVLKFGARR
ncbi:MAG: hypothetical protein AB7S41_01135 [Parvibaculaceae bacterium]